MDIVALQAPNTLCLHLNKNECFSILDVYGVYFEEKNSDVALYKIYGSYRFTCYLWIVLAQFLQFTTFKKLFMTKQSFSYKAANYCHSLWVVGMNKENGGKSGCN